MCINAQNNELQYEVFLVMNITRRHRVFNVITKKWELKYSVHNADTLFTINL